MVKIIRSLLITSLVSALFGLLFIEKFFLVFILSTILQFLFFYFFNSIYENYQIKKAVELQIAQEKNQLENTVRVLCPCGENNPQEVKLSLREDTIYPCSKCKKEVRATTNVGTTLITSPIYTEK